MLDIVRKTGLTMLLALITLTAFAQTEIKVDAPNIVESDEQFNVTFIIEGSSRPGTSSLWKFTLFGAYVSLLQKPLNVGNLGLS